MKTRLIITLAVIMGQFFGLVTTVFDGASAFAASAQQVSTGDSTACAIVDSWIKCWGNNANGQLGIGTTGGSKTSPTAMPNNKDEIPAVPASGCNWLGCSNPGTAAIPANPIAGKTVTKVSVGKAHACALANATVYCWGDNSHGQLGDRTNNSSSRPIAVANESSTSETIAAHCDGFIFFGGCVGTKVPQQTVTHPASALRQKEVIDIAAGDYYTCAIASDGTVACWGEGDNGRLGTGAATDVNFPTAVYSGNGAVLNGKKALKLAKSSGATMCVLAVDSASTSVGAGSPYCWGYGIDDGTALPTNGKTTTACSNSSSSTSPSASSATTIFSSLKPVAVPSSQVLSSLDDTGYVTALTGSKQAVYWGMYGYVKNVSYSNITSCKYTCTGTKVGLISMVDLAGYSTAGTRHVGNTTPHYQGRATPGTTAGGGTTGHGGGGSCATITHYGYTATTSYSYTGKNAATVPPAWPQTQSNFTAASGNAFDGLYCATSGASTSCDAHGTSANEGQTGSGYTQSCTTSGGFFGIGATTTCVPAPTGPQSVNNGWAAGKTLTTLSTGSTGYTCAIASDKTVGCWGNNSNGQLGVGSTNNKNIPTTVNL